MTPSPVKADAMARDQGPAVIRLQRAFVPGRRPDWKKARAAILAAAPVDTPIPKRHGYTPLLVAIDIDDLDEVPWLLDHGASMEPANPEDTEGITALECAVTHGRVTIVDRLIEQGANPNAKSDGGWYPLMTASVFWHRIGPADGACLIAKLIEHGADPSATTPDGRTLPEVFMICHPLARRAGVMLYHLDEVLAGPDYEHARLRLLDRLTVEQRAAWLPKSCVAKASMTTCAAWHRHP